MGEADSHDRILDEALRLFAHQGYSATAVREVAEAAGVTKPTLYYHFGSKEGVFHALIDRHLTGLGALVQQAIAGQGTVRERMAAFLSAYILGALAHRDALRFMMTCSLPGGDDDALECDVMVRQMQYVAPLSKVIHQGVASGELRAELDPHISVIALVGAANLHLASALNGATVDDATVERILNTWLNGVSK